jgi:type IV pilus assembly protein PilV
MRVRRIRGRSQGFSLLEVLVSLLIVSLGLLGLSKMQAAALSNTQIARARSLIALQTASLAESMHGNHFWSAGTAPATVTATGTTVTDASNILNATVDCSPTAKSTCTSAQLAAYDFQAWVTAMNTRFPGYTATVQCTTAVTTPSCVISVTWTEKYIAVNRSTTVAQGAVQTSSPLQFSLYVKP